MNDLAPGEATAREIYKYLGGGIVRAGAVTFYQGDIKPVAKIITKAKAADLGKPEAWKVGNQCVDCFDYRWASVLTESGRLIIDTSEASALKVVAEHNASLGKPGRLHVEISSFLTAIINSERDFFLSCGSRLQHAAVNLLEALGKPEAEKASEEKEVVADSVKAQTQIVRKRHSLKVWPIFFSKLLDGSKTFEARFMDRDFEVGDELELREFHSHLDTYSDKPAIIRRVSYILRGPQFGVGSGWCVMALQPILSSHPNVAGAEKAQEKVKCPGFYCGSDRVRLIYHCTICEKTWAASGIGVSPPSLSLLSET